MAKLIAFITLKSKQVVIGTLIHMRCVHHITVPLGPELMNEPIFGFISDTKSFTKHSIISITWKQVFSIKNTPSFTTINHMDCLKGLDMTLVTIMKTITHKVLD